MRCNGNNVPSSRRNNMLFGSLLLLKVLLSFLVVSCGVVVENGCWARLMGSKGPGINEKSCLKSGESKSCEGGGWIGWLKVCWIVCWKSCCCCCCCWRAVVVLL